MMPTEIDIHLLEFNPRHMWIKLRLNPLLPHKALWVERVEGRNPLHKALVFLS